MAGIKEVINGSNGVNLPVFAVILIVSAAVSFTMQSLDLGDKESAREAVKVAATEATRLLERTKADAFAANIREQQIDVQGRLSALEARLTVSTQDRFTGSDAELALENKQIQLNQLRRENDELRRQVDKMWDELKMKGARP
jgi:hypothetical protein